MKKRSTRGKRYTEYPKLRAAVRAWCADEFQMLAGYPWGKNDEAELRDDVTEPPGLDAWREVERAVLSARVWLSAYPNVEDGYTDRLRRVVAAFPEVTEPTTLHWTRRKAIVMEYDCVGRWWWHHRKPKPRELAILSILAGEFPGDWAHNRLAKQSITALEAVAAEERAIRRAREELAKANARDRANRTRARPSAVSS